MTALQGLKLDAAALSRTETAFSAVVESVAGGMFALRHGGEERMARAALGCVYQPEPGDEVLAVPAGEDIWIIALLARPGGAALRLLAPQGLTIDVRGDLTVSAPKARVAIADLFYAGRDAVCQLARIEVAAGLVRTIARQAILFAGSSLRKVDTLDQVKAGTIEQRAETNLQLSAQNAFLTADNLLRMDADQVHVG